MKHHGIYEVSSGRLTQHGSGPDFLFPAQTPVDTNFGLIELPEPSFDYYVDIGSVPHIAKTKTPHLVGVDKVTLTADGIDEVVISNITNPSTIIWPDGQEDQIIDGEARFSVDLAGRHTIKIISVTHLTEEITLEAIAEA